MTIIKTGKLKSIKDNNHIIFEPLNEKALYVKKIIK